MSWGARKAPRKVLFCSELQLGWVTCCSPPPNRELAKARLTFPSSALFLTWALNVGNCVNFGQWPFSSVTSFCLDNLGAVSDCDCKTWYCELFLCDVCQGDATFLAKGGVITDILCLYRYLFPCTLLFQHETDSKSSERTTVLFKREWDDSCT